MKIPDTGEGATACDRDPSNPLIVDSSSQRTNGTSAVTSDCTGETSAGTITTAQLCAAALAYAEAGWRVLPLRGKKPARVGVHDATTDADQIRQWWTEAHNVGIAVPEGCVVLDVDPRNGGLDTLASLTSALGDLPRTWTTRTGSAGLHLWFSVPIESARLRGSLGPGLDVKKFGGYAAAPPSIHPETGQPYAWVDVAYEDEGEETGSILALPGAWLRQLRQPVRSAPCLSTVTDPLAARGFRQWFNAALRHTPEGSRNHVLFKAAVSLAALGCLDADAEKELTDTAQAIGLGDYEIERTIRSAKERIVDGVA